MYHHFVTFYLTFVVLLGKLGDCEEDIYLLKRLKLSADNDDSIMNYFPYDLDSRKLAETARREHLREAVQSENSPWKGVWFPNNPDHTDPEPQTNNLENQWDKSDQLSRLYDSKHGVQMGVVSSHCDDGKSGLKIDWDMNPINYTCFDDRRFYQPDSNLEALYVEEFIPLKYNAMHKCMYEAIHYDRDVPSFGTHRPLWPKYGEYAFLPRQRWLHNLEHGAVVMLYHPCANKYEVNLLKKLLKSCMYRYVITPYNLLPPDRPLALVTWGHILRISMVQTDIVMNFIKQHALKGYEHTSRDGQYDFMLIEHAEVVDGSDVNDKNLCPFEKKVYYRN